MIQQFKISLSYIRKTPDKGVITALIFFGVILFLLFKKSPLSEEEEIKQLISNIIELSGIVSAILITFIVSKVIQIRQERLERRKEIVKFANKTTDFRRIARILKNCHTFWNEEMRRKIDGKYKSLDFFDIKLWDYDNQDKQPELKKLRDDFFNDTLFGAYLYLDIKSLVLDDNHKWQLELYDNYDYDFTYSIEILENWRDAHSGGNLWYCLEHKRHAYEGCFNFNGIRKDDQDEILSLCQKINSQKFKNSKFDKDLLATIGSEFDSYILPRLHELTYYNTLGLPKSLNFLLTILFMTVVSGVLIPLLITAIKVETKLLINISNLAVSILCLSIFYFLIKFKKILKAEIKVG